jgi:hypothetical protein
MTMKSRERSYNVMMYGLSEENRIMKLSKEQLRQRYKDIWDSCFGDLSETKLEKLKERQAA